MISRNRSILKVMILICFGSMFVWIVLRLATLTCSNYNPRRLDDVKREIRVLFEKVKRRNLSRFYLETKLCSCESVTNVSLNYLVLNGSVHRYLNGMPKILHTTWKNDIFENKWEVAIGYCNHVNSGFVFCHWTDDDLNLLVASEYPEILEKFLLYPYPIQRADVGRYLLLHKFGGFYRDMNVGCSVPLDRVYSEEASRHSRRTKYFSSLETGFKVLLIEGNPIGIAGDFMASVPGHSFYDHIIENLKDRGVEFGLPYLDVMLGTGPLFLGASLSAFMKNSSISNISKDEIRVTPDDEIYRQYFYFMSGNTWHCIDGTLIWLLFQYKHLITIIAFCCFISFKLRFVIYSTIRRILVHLF